MNDLIGEADGLCDIYTVKCMSKVRESDLSRICFPFLAFFDVVLIGLAYIVAKCRCKNKVSVNTIGWSRTSSRISTVATESFATPRI